MVMGTDAAPDERICRVSAHTPPQARYTVSFGERVSMDSRASDCQGPAVPPEADGAVPV